MLYSKSALVMMISFVLLCDPFHVEYVKCQFLKSDLCLKEFIIFWRNLAFTKICVNLIFKSIYDYTFPLEIKNSKVYDAWVGLRKYTLDDDLNFDFFFLSHHCEFEPPDLKNSFDFTLSYPWNVQIWFLNLPNRPT